MDIIQNESLQRFQMEIEGNVAYIEYKIMDNKYYLISTHVPDFLGGKGIGSKLVNLTLEHIKSLNMKVVPVCTFIQAYFKRHPEFQNGLA